jgi:xylulokinase
MTKYLLGIDIGTTSTKAILLHPEEGIIASADAPSTLISQQAGWAEEDPTQWWKNVAIVTKNCLTMAGIGGTDVAAIGVSGMVPTLILLDNDGEVLHPSIQQNDARAFLEIQEFNSKLDNIAVLNRTGSAITQQSIGPKLLWLRRNHAEIMEKASHVMGSYDYIAYKLTGNFSAERNWALESGLFDYHIQDWDKEILSTSTISTEWLGKVNWSTEIVGKVTEHAAIFTGLCAGIPVVAGSADHIASAFSAGLTSPGDMLIKLGGAGDILYSMDEPLTDSRLFLDYHIVPDKYYINGCMAASGSIIQWFRNEFAPGVPFKTLDEEAAAISPGSNGLILLPYFLGEKTPINDPMARGVFFGLTLSHTRGHLYRAILEGIAFGFYHHLMVLKEKGLLVKKARVTNGGARSKLWKQITADVLNIPLEQIANHPGSSMGAAFVAGKGIGVFQDWEEIEQFIEITKVVEPNPKLQSMYGELFSIYRELYERNQDLFEKLNKIT